MHTASGSERVFATNIQLIENFRKNQLSIEDLKQLETPLLLSVGDRDELVPLHEILDLYQALGYNKTALSIHPNTRHQISALSPESIGKAARHFWKEML